MSLGRGLGALITSTDNKKTRVVGSGKHSDESKIWQVPLSAIQQNPHQPRKHFAPAELQELAQSIREHGILQPLLVDEQADGGYQLIAGERRLRAAQLAGLATVPVMVKAMAEREKLEVALIENIQREDLNAIEEAVAYTRLIKEFGLTQEQVASKVGKSRPAVANTVRLLDLPQQVQEALIEGAITRGQARALLSLPTAADQLAMLGSMRGEKITVRELERTAQQSKPAVKVRRDPNLVYLEDRLRSALGAKARLSGSKRGVLTIEYHSPEELRGIVEKIVGDVT